MEATKTDDAQGCKEQALETGDVKGIAGDTTQSVACQYLGITWALSKLQEGPRHL